MLICCNKRNYSIAQNVFVVILVLFLTGCMQHDLTFTFNNKTNYTIDSIQVAIRSQQGCLQQNWQLESIRKLLPYSTAKLTIAPDQQCDGSVTVAVFKDTLERIVYGKYFSNGAFPRDQFNDERLKFSIVECDTGIIRIVNDSDERGTMKVKHVTTEFNYVDGVSSDFKAKPTFQLKGDTLIVNDYFAMPHNVPLLVTSSRIGVSFIMVTYSEMQSDVVDSSEHATVEAVSKFIGTFANEFTVRIEPFRDARVPTDFEKEQGFRNARLSVYHSGTARNGIPRL